MQVILKFLLKCNIFLIMNEMTTAEILGKQGTCSHGRCPQTRALTALSPDSAVLMADTSERVWLGAQGPREEALVFAVGFMIALFTCALIMRSLVFMGSCKH